METKLWSLWLAVRGFSAQLTKRSQKNLQYAQFITCLLQIRKKIKILVHNPKVLTSHVPITFATFICSCLQDEMTKALATMRVEYDQVTVLKDISKSSNPLLNRRKDHNP